MKHSALARMIAGNNRSADRQAETEPMPTQKATTVDKARNGTSNAPTAVDGTDGTGQPDGQAAGHQRRVTTSRNVSERLGSSVGVLRRCDHTEVPDFAAHLLSGVEMATKPTDDMGELVIEVGCAFLCDNGAIFWVRSKFETGELDVLWRRQGDLVWNTSGAYDPKFPNELKRLAVKKVEAPSEDYVFRRAGSWHIESAKVFR